MADGITRIAVEGFKSISKKQSIDIAPLTILAGANSSGKSSIMQPLLMLKQTLDVGYDPGPLEIDGDNVKFTSSDQFLARTKDGSSSKLLTIEVRTPGIEYAITFRKAAKSGMEVVEQRQTLGEGGIITLRPEMTLDELHKALNDTPYKDGGKVLGVVRKRFLLDIDTESLHLYELLGSIDPSIRNVIHLPGLRGNRERVYKLLGTRSIFPSTFDLYAASIVEQWKSEGDPRLDLLNGDLQLLGMAEKVEPHRLNEAQIDLRVNRVAGGGPNDMVSIADVGFGVSQVLPLLVALRVAGPDNLVYLEEPEIHLHPRAQVKLADLLEGATIRGPRIVVETHSTLLLTAIQTLVAKGKLPPSFVKLYWFQRDQKTGITEVIPADLDENGAFGDWPEDFDDVILKAESAYLDAVEGHQVR
jgi:predicted ATPase